MKNSLCKLFLLICINLSISGAFAQVLNNETKCSTDTIIIKNKQNKSFYPDSQKTSVIFQKYLRCETRSPYGIRLDFGVSKYIFDQKTRDWLGNFNCPYINFNVVYNQVNLGFKFKTWSVNPLNVLNLDGNILPKTIKLLPIMMDLYLSYSLDIPNYNFSLEPGIGYTTTVLKVPNENYYTTFNLLSARGLIAGLTANTYFKIGQNEFFTIFFNFSYASIDFKKIHPDLGNEYLEYTLGIGYKGFFKKNSNKVIK